MFGFYKLRSFDISGNRLILFLGFLFLDLRKIIYINFSLNMIFRIDY